MTSQMAQQRRGYRRYGPVWSVRPVRWAFAGTLTARLAQTMVPLTFLLLFHQRPGGFAAAGAMVAVYGLASVAGGPLSARLVDRYGARVLLAVGLVNAACLVLLAVTTSPVASWGLVVALGASVPPLTPALRATIMTYLTGEGDRAAAFSLDAVGTEVLFVAGPAVVAAAVAIANPADALIVAAGLVLAGSASATIVGRQARAPGREVPGRPAASPGRLLALWLGIAAAEMAAVGFVEVSVTARTVHFGRPASAGTVLAIWAVGSVVGGLIYGGRDWPGTAARQLCVLLLLVGGGFAFVAAAPSLAWLYPLMFAAGLACAPAATALTTSFSRASGSRTETFAWLASSSNLGGSFGYAAAGLLLEHTGITITILIGAAFPAAAAVAAGAAARRAAAR